MTSYYESFTFYLLEYFFRQYLYLFYKFSKILISSQGNHDDHCLFSMIILLLLLLERYLSTKLEVAICSFTTWDGFMKWVIVINNSLINLRIFSLASIVVLLRFLFTKTPPFRK